MSALSRPELSRPELPLLLIAHLVERYGSGRVEITDEQVTATYELSLSVDRDEAAGMYVLSTAPFPESDRRRERMTG